MACIYIRLMFRSIGVVTVLYAAYIQKRGHYHYAVF